MNDGATSVMLLCAGISSKSGNGWKDQGPVAVAPSRHVSNLVTFTVIAQRMLHLVRSTNSRLSLQRAGRVGARIGSTKHEEHWDTQGGVQQPGGSDSGSLFGDKRRDAAVGAGEAAPETGEELVIMPRAVFEDKRVTKQRRLSQSTNFGRVLYQDGCASWSV